MTSRTLWASLTRFPKLLITGIVLVAFLVGAIFEGFTKFGVTKAFSPPAPSNNLAASPPATAITLYDSTGKPVAMLLPVSPGQPVSTMQPLSNSVAPTRTRNVRSRPVRRHRSWESQALIVGGSAGAGAGIGAIAGGGKGAGIGALSGGVAGLIYNLATRDR